MCNNDGGYFAIKGFLYQFDKAILEILDSKDEYGNIYIENVQDINYDKYIIQVKHKESATYSNSKVRDPIIQLIELYKNDPSKQFCLYGYFKDKEPSTIIFETIEQIDEILKYNDEEKTNNLKIKYTQDIRLGFIKNFKLCFGEDYVGQFNIVLDFIKREFNLNSDDAIIYHALIREKLLSISIIQNPTERKTTKKEIIQHIEQCKKNVFYNYYGEYITRESYLKLIKKEYFTFKSANINDFERLFVIDCDSNENKTDIRMIIDNIRNKYHRPKKSPVPYICFNNIGRSILNEVKMELLDDQIMFSDGTYFNGDRFRIERLKDDGKNNNVLVKLVDRTILEEIVSNINIKEYYHLFKEKPIKFNSQHREINVQINHISEVLKIIC